ncbi:hypothetical protein [Amycolatopsis camponoti]|nr:hypothetical protein [Amycolatopsis camponoti]
MPTEQRATPINDDLRVIVIEVAVNARELATMRPRPTCLCLQGRLSQEVG